MRLRTAGLMSFASKELTRRQIHHDANGIKTRPRFPCLDVLRRLRLAIVVSLAGNCRHPLRTQSWDKHRNKRWSESSVRREARLSFDQRFFAKTRSFSASRPYLRDSKPIRQTVIDVDHRSQIKIRCSRNPLSEDKSGVAGSQRLIRGIITGEPSA
jgi:hypothetical protein